MNQERILELAKQADPDHWHSRWCSGINPRVMDPEIKKLAELIVRKCTDVIINDPRLSDVRSATRGCARSIKEHFGVEE